VCEMLNLFVPAAPLGEIAPVRGLRFGPSGEVQSQLRGWLGDRRGTTLVGSGPAGCLCGFVDWDALERVVRDVLAREGVDEVVVMRFWSGAVYPHAERILELDDGAHAPPAMGELVRMRALSPEMKRHRDLVRALSDHAGEEVTLAMRSGGAVRGTLAFDVESEVGSIGARAFVVWEILRVERGSR
jgi:hypothetical protein